LILTNAFQILSKQSGTNTGKAPAGAKPTPGNAFARFLLISTTKVWAGVRTGSNGRVDFPGRVSRRASRKRSNFEMEGNGYEGAY